MSRDRKRKAGAAAAESRQVRSRKALVAGWSRAFLAALLGVALVTSTAQAAPPANDDFDQAVVLAGLPISTTGTNTDATSEPGEPQHIGQSLETGAGASVWYEWAAATTGAVAVDLAGSDFDGIVAVYTGSAVNDLDLVTAKGGLFNCSSGCRVAFKATAGTTYRIAVDGDTSGQAHGTIALAIEQTNLISGTVTDTSGDPLESICVDALPTSPGAFTLTDADGHYTLERAPGDYKVFFSDCMFSHSVIDEYYDNQPAQETANPVQVLAGEAIEGIDAELASEPTDTTPPTTDDGNGGSDDDSPGPAPAPGPTPHVAPPLNPGVAFFARIGQVRGNKALIRTRCAGDTTCRGVARLIARIKTRHVVKRHGKRRAVRRARNVMVGKSRFNLAPRRAGVLRIRLTGIGRKLLHRSGRRGLRVKLVGQGLRNHAVKLKLPSRKKRTRRETATAAVAATPRTKDDACADRALSAPRRLMGVYPWGKRAPSGRHQIQRSYGYRISFVPPRMDSQGLKCSTRGQLTAKFYQERRERGLKPHRNSGVARVSITGLGRVADKVRAVRLCWKGVTYGDFDKRNRTVARPVVNLVWNPARGKPQRRVFRGKYRRVC